MNGERTRADAERTCADAESAHARAESARAAAERTEPTTSKRSYARSKESSYSSRAESALAASALRVREMLPAVLEDKPAFNYKEVFDRDSTCRCRKFEVAPLRCFGGTGADAEQRVRPQRRARLLRDPLLSVHLTSREWKIDARPRRARIESTFVVSSHRHMSVTCGHGKFLMTKRVGPLRRAKKQIRKAYRSRS